MEIGELIPEVDQHFIQDSTKVTCFMTCPRRYFYEYVLGWREETPNNHLVFGAAWHKAMEVILEKGYDAAHVMEAYDAFLKEYRKSLPPETDELFHPKTPDNALIVLAKYAQHYATDLKEFKVLHIEIGGRVAINDTQSMYFKMDTVCESPRGIFSLEHKTAGSFYLWDMQFPLSMQVGTYTHVLYCMYPTAKVAGVKMNGVAFKKVKRAWDQIATGQKLTVQSPYDFHRFDAFRTKEQMHNWQWNAQYWLDQIQSNFNWLKECTPDDPLLYSFPMNTTNCTKYNGCPWQDFCNAWANPLARCEEPPLGFKIDHWDPTAEEVQTEVNVTDGVATITQKEKELSDD